MKNSLSDLEKLITKNLQSSNSLKNELESKELEKHDLLKSISLGIIDTLDSFESIEESFIEKGLDKNEESKKIINRYKTVQKKLVNLLQKNGISQVEFPDKRLIVGLCEVIETEPDSNRKNDEIISVVRNGYIRGNELIRAAQIIIVKN